MTQGRPWIDRMNLGAALWSIIYCFLVVAVCGLLIDAEVSPYLVVPIGLFVLPLLASIPFLLGWGRFDAGDSS